MNRSDSRLKEVFQEYPAIQAVYLFGSRATGKTHLGSDLDLAVVPGNSRIRSQKINILTDLARLGIDNIDLVFLDTEDIVLKYEAVKQNQLIYQTEKFNRGEMYSRVVRQYLDFKPYLKVQREAFKRRLGNGQ
jgi:predicted nucleotidyltransferase